MENLGLDCFASKELSLPCTGALVDSIDLKFVKLGPIIFVSMVNGFTFTATGNSTIVIAADAVPIDLRPSTSFVYSGVVQRMQFNGDGGIEI